MLLGIIIGIAGGSFFLIFAVVLNNRRRRFLQNGIETEAIIQEVNLTGYAHKEAVYEYNVAGNNYKGKDVILGSHNAGDKITILYFADNPAKSMLVGNTKGPSLGVPIGVFIFFALLGFAIVVGLLIAI